MSKAKLKKALQELDPEQLKEVIFELYDLRPEAKEYLDFWIDPDIEKESEKYRIRIFRIFFISEERPRKNPDFKELKTLLKYYASLGIDPEKRIELKLYTLDIYAIWLSSRNKVMTHQKRVNTMLEETKDYIETHQLMETYGLRVQRNSDEFSRLFERGDKRGRRGWHRWHM